MLTIDLLTVQVSGKTLLDQVSLQVQDGELLSLLGPSGSGKTTLLRSIMGLMPTQQGSLSLGEQLLASEGQSLVATEDRPFAYLFQEFTLFPHLSVKKNILLGIRDEEPAIQKSRLEELSELLGITPLLKRPIHSLSGGEQQRVALARTLVMNPRFLLLDEPFSNLDRQSKERLYRELRSLLRERGIGALLATHDQQEAFYFSDRLAVLADGEVQALGSPRELYHDPGTRWLAEFTGESLVLDAPELQRLFPHSGLEQGESFLLRPEDLRFLPGEGAWHLKSVDFHGFFSMLHLTHSSGTELQIPCLAAELPEPDLRGSVELIQPPRVLHS